jgi:hypothetical protein
VLITEGMLVRVADRLRVLGQVVRLRLVEQLRAGEATPQELADTLGVDPHRRPGGARAARGPALLPRRVRAGPLARDHDAVLAQAAADVGIEILGPPGALPAA